MKFSLTTPRSNLSAKIALLFWALTLLSISIWSLVPSYKVGWDLEVYRNALVSLHAGHDPYEDGMIVQRVFHSHLAEHPDAVPPYTYVYSPLTLPLLRAVGHFPIGLIATVYWILYAAATIVVLWICFRFVEEEERPVFALIAPAVVFFPGLLQNDVLFSGNIAALIYGLAFAAAYLGWRRGIWTPFYLVVLAASCFKAPLLSLLAIPVLSQRRAWVPAALTGFAGVALFAMQPRIWPTLFSHYLQAVELQFSFNHDFSSSPAGLLADALYNVVPYRITSLVFYLFYAAILLTVLLYFSREYLAGHLSLKQWVPVLLIGVVLLNPRIMEYDVAPISFLMALVLWRVFAQRSSVARTLVGTSLLFLAANAYARLHWRFTECLLLAGLFGAGSVQLYVTAREARRLDIYKTEMEAPDFALDAVY